jgi:hypothetical protein
MFKGPFGEVPRPPEPTPLDSPPSRPHRLLESPVYLLGALGGYLHRMRVWDPLAGPCVDMPVCIERGPCVEYLQDRVCADY